jgi:hypothetical protein
MKSFLVRQARIRGSDITLGSKMHASKGRSRVVDVGIGKRGAVTVVTSFGGVKTFEMLLSLKC